MTEQTKWNLGAIIVLLGSYAFTCVVGVGFYGLPWGQTFGLYFLFVIAVGPGMGFLFGFFLNMAIVSWVYENVMGGLIYGFIMLVQIVPAIVLFFYLLFFGEHPEDGFIASLTTMGVIAYFIGLGFAIKHSIELINEQKKRDSI